MGSVAPWPEFLLADSLRIADEDLSKTDIPIFYGFNLNLFAECHSITRKIHFVKRVSAKDPHTGLGIVHPSEKQQGHYKGQYPISDFVFCAHRVVGEDRKPGGGEKSNPAVHEGFEQVTESVNGIRVISIQSDNNIPRRARKPALVCSTVSSMQFGYDVCSHFAGNCCCPIRGTVVNDDDFIHKWRQILENLLDSLFLVEAWDDDGDPEIFVHRQRRTLRNR